MENNTLRTWGNYSNIFDYAIVSEVSIDKDNKIERVGDIRVQFVTQKGSLNFIVTEKFMSDYIGKEFSIEKYYMVMYENALHGSVEYDEFLTRVGVKANKHARKIHNEYKAIYKKFSRIFDDIYFID